MGKDFNALQFDLGEYVQIWQLRCKMQNSLWMNVDYTSAIEQCPNVFKPLYLDVFVYFTVLREC